MLSEDEVHTLVQTNKVVQNGIINALKVANISDFIHEDVYINGITADFTLVNDGVIEAIMECKSGKINLTEYVRGIGQLLQYEYFAEEKISHKSYEYSSLFKTIYLYPSSVINNNSFNIAKFKYPNTTVIFELNEINNAIRVITSEELNKLKQTSKDNLVSISQYYFRDNRIFEYYLLIQYLMYVNLSNVSYLDRKEAEITFLRYIDTINNNNWRNAFITLSNLGIINHKNLLTEAGKQLGILSYEDFAIKMYHSYLKPYFIEILNVLVNQMKYNYLIKILLS